MNRLLAMVSDRALKKAPVTPPRNASGTKIIMVAAEEPVSGEVNSIAASRIVSATLLLCWRRRRMICSIMTMASSTIRPTAAAIPPSVIILKLMCKMFSNKMVVASTAGTISIATSVIFRLRKKTSRTIAASATPIAIASRTLLADSVISWLWSYQLAIFTPAGILLA